MASDSTQGVTSTCTSAALISLLLTYAAPSGTPTPTLNLKISTGSTHPLLSLSRPEPMHYLRIACLRPQHCPLILANGRRARVTSLRLAFSVQEKEPASIFQCMSACGPAPILPTVQRRAPYPFTPTTLLDCNAHQSSFSRPKLSYSYG